MTAGEPTVAVVTGASRGIGRAVAVRLAAEGYVVVAAARHRPVIDVDPSVGGRVHAQVADVTREADVERLGDAAVALGRLTVWVNNAGTVEPRPLVDLEVEVWDRTLDVNLRGSFLGCRAALRRMRAGGGVIVNVASLGAVPYVDKLPGLAAYTAAKAGVVGLTEAVAAEGRPWGVRCLALSPGAVDTEMLRRAAPGLRPGVTPEDVAALVAWLVSDAARPLTGINLPVLSNA